MTYLATSINQSPVIATKAGAAIEDVRGKAVKFSDGNVILCSTAGETVLGIGIMTNDENIAEGGQVDVQIKDIGLVKAGAAIAKGDELAVDASGTFQKATASQHVFAIALEAGETGEFIPAMIVRYNKAAG